MNSMDHKHQYIAIDLKSFYASVECVERGLDALDTNLVVADASRTAKTICLAVSPALKRLGIGGRPRLFEVIRKVNDANICRRNAAKGHRLYGKSYSANRLAENPALEIDYIVAPPRMALYVDYSTRIYKIYLRHVAPEDIHVYSVDEVFIDATSYLQATKMTAHELAMAMIREVLAETGITATAGIGTNMYLAKIAMDIVAKHMEPDADGVRIAELDEMKYRQKLWGHRPLTDFWRIGRGIARKLEEYGLMTMGDIAQCSLEHENLLYRLFGVNAELIIDHAWGWEPVTIDIIKSYKPESHSISSGQVLTEPYTVQRARVVLMEMAENLALELVEGDFKAESITIHIGYDAESLIRQDIKLQYNGPVDKDHYGRLVPRHTNGSVRFHEYTSSVREIMESAALLFDRTANPILLIRRMSITANNLQNEKKIETASRRYLQLDLFADYDELARIEKMKRSRIEREKRLSNAVIDIKHKFGKNSILRGLNFADGATQRLRNEQIGGHKA